MNAEALNFPDGSFDLALWVYGVGLLYGIHFAKSVSFVFGTK
jgi:hypothetical protein